MCDEAMEPARDQRRATKSVDGALEDRRVDQDVTALRSPCVYLHEDWWVGRIAKWGHIEQYTR